MASYAFDCWKCAHRSACPLSHLCPAWKNHATVSSARKRLIRTAIVGSRAAAARYKRLRLASYSNPPAAATGGFPYNLASVADVRERNRRSETPPTFRQSDYGYGQ